MKSALLILSFFVLFEEISAQKLDTFMLYKPISKYDTAVYKRIIRFDTNDSLYHVEDYYESGQIQMKGAYSSFDKTIKENYWCNYRTNTKQGLYETWYKNGQLESRSTFVDGEVSWTKRGMVFKWADKFKKQLGERANIEGNTKGQKHGASKGWDKEGNLNCNMVLKNGLKVNPKDTNYYYIYYTPQGYKADTLKKWPLIIYLHGGSARGTDTIELYNYGIPDQIWRKREFPFIIVAPQCPVDHRWSTDNWFENFYNEITTRFKVDTNRVYSDRSKPWWRRNMVLGYQISRKVCSNSPD
jgi:hypothetical protein